MRISVLAIVAVVIATPAMAETVVPQSPVVRTADATSEQPRAAVGDAAVQSVARGTPAVFSEPTEPVPPMPSQRKLLRMRKV